MEKSENYGIVYLLTNEAMPGLVNQPRPNLRTFRSQLARRLRSLQGSAVYVGEITMETIQASRNLIDLFKSYINGNHISETELNDLLVTIAIEIDNRKIKGDESELTAELEKLYDDAMWFKCNIMKL